MELGRAPQAAKFIPVLVLDGCACHQFALASSSTSRVHRVHRLSAWFDGLELELQAEMLLLRRAVGLGVGLPLRPAAPCVCGGRSGGLRALTEQRVVCAGQRVAPLATAASRWPGWSSLDERAGGSRAVALAPAALEHPWRAGLAGRGFAKAVRVAVDVEQTRANDPQQMLNMFRRKCRQNNVHNKVRAKRYHKKPTQVKRKRLLRCAETCQPA